MARWLLLTLALSACSPAEPGYHVDSYFEQKVEDLAEEIRIPSQAWDLIEESAEKQPTSLSRDFVFAEVKVLLVEKNPGVLKRPAYRISLPRGGGEIDLSDYRGLAPGSFYVGFEYPDFEEASQKKALFVSQAKKRRIDGSVYGMGCDSFADITNRFFKGMAGEGLKVNTTQDRHLSVMGGRFLFSAHKDKVIYISQVTFTDSDHKNLFCEGL